VRDEICDLRGQKYPSMKFSTVLKIANSVGENKEKGKGTTEEKERVRRNNHTRKG